MKRLIMPLLTILACWLRLALILRPEPFWYDEAFSYLVAKLPLARLLAATAGDVHPPAYYLILKGWLALWPEPMELSARALSFSLSLIALYLYWRLLQRLNIAETARLVAWIVVLFTPSLVYYAGEARMYALLECYILAALLTLWPAARPSTEAGLECLHPDLRVIVAIAQGVGGGLLMAGAALTHNAGIVWGGLLLAAMLLVSRRQPHLGSLFIAAGVAVIAYLPWTPAFLSQLHNTQAGYWTWQPTLGTCAYMQFMSLFYNPHLPDNGLDALLMLLVAGLTTVGLLLTARKRPAVALLAVGFPIAALVGSRIAGVGMLLHRLMIPGAFFVAILWSAILTRRDVGRVTTALLIVALAYVNSLSLTHGRTGASYAPVIQALRAHPADLLYGNNSAILPVSLYTGIPAAIVSGYADPLGAGLTAPTLAALDVPVARLEDLEWDQAYVLHFTVPGSSPEETAYIYHLLEHYPSGLITDALGDNNYTHGALYLVSREAAQH